MPCSMLGSAGAGTANRESWRGSNSNSRQPLRRRERSDLLQSLLRLQPLLSLQPTLPLLLQQSLLALKRLLVLLLQLLLLLLLPLLLPRPLRLLFPHLFLLLLQRQPLQPPL